MRSSSAVVDTKVAEIQLDNTNFEKNAATTISTVQKLQQALDFSVSGKGFDDINASVKKVNFDPINKGIETTKSGFSALEAVAFGVFTRIGSKIADVGISIATAIPKQIISGGSKRSLNVQQAEFQIKGLAESMGYVGDAWEDLSADIDHAVSGTAYGMDVAALAASQLMASGVKFGETFGTTGSSPMAKALRGISGVAAMTSSSYEDITNVFTKIAGQGAIMGGELQQLSSRGLNVAADLAKFFNGVNDGSIKASDTVTAAVKKVTTSVSTSESDIRDWASKRKISFDIFAEAMDRAYGEHATKANETFAGSLTNVKAQLSKIGEIFATPVYENGQKFFSSLYDVVKDLRVIIQDSKFAAWFKETANTVGDKFASAFGKAHTALQGFINSKNNKAVETFRKAFGGAFESFDEKTGIITKMRESLGFADTAKEAEENTKKIAGSFEAVKDTVLATIRGDYANGMERVKNLTEAGFNAESIQGYVNQLWELTGHDWSKLSDDIYAQVTAQEELQEATEDTGKTTEESIGPLGHVLSGILNLWSGITNVISIARGLIDAWWSHFTSGEGILGRVAAKFDEIAQAFNTFTVEHADEIGQVFTGIGSAIMIVWDAVSFAGKAVWNFVSGIFKGFGQSLWDILVLVSNAITNFRNWAKENQILENTLKAIQWVGETVASTIKNLWGAFTNLPIVKTAVESLGGAFTYLKDNFLAVTSKGSKVLQRFWSMLRVGFKFSKNPKELFGNIKGAFTYLWSEIKASVTVSKIKEAFGSVKDTIKGFFEDLGKNEDGSLNTFGKLQNGFGKFISSIGNSIAQFKKDGDFKNLFGNIGLSFKGLWNSVKASGFFDNIKEGFKTAKDAVIGFLDDLGTNADGSLNLFGKIWTKIKETVGPIIDWYGDILSGLPDFVSGAVSAFGDFMTKVGELGGIKFDNLGDVWQTFKDTFLKYFQDNDYIQSTIVDPLVNGFTTIKDTIKEKLEEAGVPIDNLTAKFQNFFDTISQAWEDFKSEGLLGAISKLFTGDTANAAEVVDGGELEEAGSGLSAFFGFLGSIDPNTVLKVVTALVALKSLKGVFENIRDLIGSIRGFIDSEANLNNAEARDIERQGKANGWLKLAAAIGIIAYAIYEIGSLDVELIKQGAIVVGAIAAAFLVFNFLADKLAGAKNIANVGDGLLRFAGAIAIIAIVAAAVSLVSWDRLEDGLAKVAVVGGLLLVAGVALALISRLGGEHMSGAGEALEKFVSAVSHLVTLTAVVSIVPWDTLTDGLKKIAMIGGVLLAALLALSIAARISGGKGVIALGGVIAVIAAVGGVMYLLGKYGDAEKYIPIAESIAILLGSLSAIMLVSKFTGPLGGFSAALNLVEFLGTIVIVLGAIRELGKLIGNDDLLGDMGDLLGKLGEGIGKLIGGIAKGAAVKVGEIPDETIDKVIGFVEKLAAIDIKPQKIKESAGLFGASSSIDQSLMTFAKGIGGVIDAINWLDVYDEDTGNLDEKVKFFDNIVDFVSRLADIEIPEQKILDTVGPWGMFENNSIDKSLETFADGIQGVVDAVNDVDTPDNKSELNRKIQYFQSIVDFVDGLASIEIPEQKIIDTVGPWGMFKNNSVDKSLETFADGMQGVVDAVNDVEFGPGDILAMLPKKIYFGMIVDFVAGLAAIKIPVQEISSSKGLWGALGSMHIDQSLFSFSVGMMGVIDAVNSVEFGLGDVLLLYPKKAYLETIVGFVAGLASIQIPVQTIETSKGLWGRLGKMHIDQSLETFASGMDGVVGAVNNLEFNLLDALMLQPKAEYFSLVASFVEKLAAINIPVQTSNIAKWEGLFKGSSEQTDSSLVTFGKGMVEVGKALNTMEKPKVSLTDVDLMASCVEVMANSAAHIKGTNVGISKWLNGDNSLSRFAEEMAKAAPHVVTASKNADGIDGDNVNNLVNAIQPMMDVINTIVEGAGGDEQFYTNHLTLISSFADQVGDIGKEFGKLKNLKDIHVEDIERIPDIMDALKKVSEVDLADFGEWSEDGMPFLNLNDYIQALADIGINVDLDGLASISSALTTIQAVDLDTGDIYDESIVTTLDANIKTISTMISGLSGLDTSGVDKLTSAVDKINSAKIEGAMKKIADSNTADTGKDTGKQISDSISSGIDSDSIGSSLSGALTKALSGVSTSGFVAVGRSLSVAIASGVSLSASNVLTAIKGAVKDASSSAGDYKGSFITAGNNLSLGLAQGIRNGRSNAINAAKDVAVAALNAAKASLQIASPSKAMERVGMFFDLGFVKGMSNYSYKVYNESSDVARHAMDGLVAAVELTNDILSDDLNQPVITPVVDLSQVEMGANQMAGLFDSSPLLSTNFGIIRNNADAIRQRVESNDILTALSDLGNSLSSGSGDTYIVNGVTYDDGSNISETVKELIRAAKVERRA